MLSSQEIWNLLTPTPSTPPRHDAHGAPHSKPVEWPGDGSHLTRKRPQSNDDQLHTLCANVQLNLIFNDGGTAHWNPALQLGPEQQRNDDIIHDTRPPLDKTEARELARILKADIIVNVEQWTYMETRHSDPTGLKWYIETRQDGPWTYTTPMQSHVLAGINKAITTTLHCRTKPGVTQDVHLILARIIKGKSRLMFFDAEMRQTVMFKLFGMLLQAAQPAVLLGNFGMSLISIVMYAKEYEDHTGAHLTDQIQLLPNADQELICISLATRERSRTVVQIDAELCPPRMFVVNLVDESATCTDGSTEQLDPNRAEHERKKLKSMVTDQNAQSIAARPEERRMANDGSPSCRQAGDDQVTWKYTSDGAHLTGSSGPQRATAKPRTQMYIQLMSHLTLLSEREYKWQQARTKWPLYLHLHPVTPKSQRSDGTHVVGPVDMQATLQRLDGALKIAEEARKQSGITHYNQTLTNQQREKAHQWLQYQCFEKVFILNPALSQMVSQFHANPDSCKGPQRKTLKDKRRGAFKAWKQSLLGNTALFNMILTSGILETSCIDMRCFLLRYVQEIQKKEHPINAHFLEERRMAAITARKTLKDAQEFQVLIKHHQDANIGVAHTTIDVFLLERMTAEVGSERAQNCVDYTMQRLRQLEAGELENDCQTADAYHRFGQEWIASRITSKDAEMFQSSIRQMKEFKGQ